MARQTEVFNYRLHFLLGIFRHNTVKKKLTPRAKPGQGFTEFDDD